MNAIELADLIDETIGGKTATTTMLREQHEAIVKLREALGDVMKFNNGNHEWVKALKVLNATEDLK